MKLSEPLEIRTSMSFYLQYPMLFYSYLGINYRGKFISSINTAKKPHNKIEIISSSRIIPLKSISEDNLIIRENFMIICDGVGSWKNHGVDPVVYSRSLCEESNNIMSKVKVRNENELKNKIICAIKSLKAKNILGGTTFCSVYFDTENKKIFSCSLGDTVFGVYRLLNDGEYFLQQKSQEQYHSFNRPFQVGHIGDNPEESLSYSVEVKESDIVIIGSDGLWDNLNEDEILQFLNKKRFSSQEEINKFAYDLSEQAKDNSKKKFYQSPFALKAKENGKFYCGGKPDDISIIVVLVKETETEFEDFDDNKSRKSMYSLCSKMTDDCSNYDDVNELE